eukprot:12220067-Alexandrium_andersonii.AAC.1
MIAWRRGRAFAEGRRAEHQSVAATSCHAQCSLTLFQRAQQEGGVGRRAKFGESSRLPGVSILRGLL